MAKAASRRTAMVADRRPLERGLARFLLEERGLFVVGEAATMADVLLQVQQLKPDLVVLHEKLALDHDPTVIAQIRRTSPRTSIVLLSANPDALPPELVLLADTVVQDGPGLTELGAAVAGAVVVATVTPEAASETTEATAGAAAATVARLRRSTGSRWADRLQGLAMASIIALAFVVARNVTTPSPTVEGSAHLQAARHSLDELESALPTATTAEIAEIASALIDERAAAEAAGINLAPFDEELRARLVSLWSSLPLEVQALLVALFGEIIDDSDVAPLPSPSPSRSPEPSPPQPSPDPSPEPSEAPAPAEEPPPLTETTSPPPTETTTPPTETTTPPTETTTPPTETTTPPTETTTPPTETTTPPTETTTPPTETTTPPTETTTPPTETTTPPTETTTPPTETTTPPTETTTPPTETTTPPTETTTPPTETTTSPPPIGETQSGALVFIPFGLTLLLAITGWTRRRSNTEKRDRPRAS